MKKLNTKFIASLVIAGMVASAASVSASAAINYRYTPYYPAVDTTDTTGGQTDAGTDEKDDTESTPAGASVIGPAAVEEAIKNGTPVQVTIENGKAVLQEAAVAAIAAGGKPVTFEVTGADVPYTVTIAPEDITENKDFNLAMDVHVVGSGNADGLTAGFVYIGWEMEQTWNLALGLTVPASALEDLEFDNIGFYYLDDDGIYYDYSDDLTKNADKSVTIKLRHNSAYIIADVDLTANNEEPDDIIEPDDDEGAEIVPDDGANQGKDDTSVVVNPGGTDTNPVTGTTLALGSLAVFAAAAVATSKKRK